MLLVHALWSPGKLCRGLTIAHVFYQQTFEQFWQEVNERIVNLVVMKLSLHRFRCLGQIEIGEQFSELAPELFVND